MSKKNIFILCGIFLAAILFRLMFIDKPGGLWYDEMVSYKEAVCPNIFAAIIYTLKTDVHLPLYPVLLHIWTKIFSAADISLRLFSAVCGILTCITAYFAGKALRCEKTGMLAALVFALNSFLIYYSQEVRLYSLLMLLSTLLTYFAVKFQKDNSIKTAVLFAITAWAVIHTYTISFIYVISCVAVLYYLRLKDKQPIKGLNWACVLLVFMCIPSLIFLILNYKNYTTQINGFYCDWSSMLVVLQDWFTPVITGINNNPVHYAEYLVHNLSCGVIFFILLPLIISLSLIVYAVKKDKTTFYLLIPSFVFILAEIAAFKFTNFKILARYTSLALPNILFVLTIGMMCLPKIKRVNIIIPLILFLLNAAFLIFSPNAAYKLPRDGFRALAGIFIEFPVNAASGDFIVVWNRKEILDKYIDTEKLNVLSILKDFSYRSERILGHEKELNKLSLEERKALLREYFAELTPPRNNIEFMRFILSNMKKGQKFIITSNSYFDKFSPEMFLETVNDNQKYDLISYNDLLTIKSLILIKEICAYNLKFAGRYEKGGWVVLVFEK